MKQERECRNINTLVSTNGTRTTGLAATPLLNSQGVQPKGLSCQKERWEFLDAPTLDR